MHTLSRYLDELHGLLRATACTGPGGAPREMDAAFATAVALIDDRTAAGGAIMFVGNGGSAAIASHVVVDFFNAGMRATAFNDGPLLTCMGNDYGYEQVFAKPISLHARPGDLLVAISSSGQSRNILNAVAAGRERGCAVITLSGFRPDNPLRALGDHNFYVASTSYGYVEIAHQALCHAFFDLLKQKRHV
jgi:D-sedoheptulose 7-phosphate isomerase